MTIRVRPTTTATVSRCRTERSSAYCFTSANCSFPELVMSSSSSRAGDLAAHHVDDEEVVGQDDAERIMIGGEQGIEERFLACEDLTGVIVLCRLHWLRLLVICRQCRYRPASWPRCPGARARKLVILCRRDAGSRPCAAACSAGVP